MKTENKMNKLKAAAWDAKNAEIEADDACECARVDYHTARINYNATRKALTGARLHHRQACYAAHAYKTEDK